MVQIVTVFGGTGFLGRRIVGHLHDKGFFVRIASRRPNPSSGDDPQLRAIAGNIHDRQSIASAIGGAFGVVNAVSRFPWSWCRGAKALARLAGPTGLFGARGPDDFKPGVKRGVAA